MYLHSYIDTRPFLGEHSVPRSFPGYKHRSGYSEDHVYGQDVGKTSMFIAI